VSPAARSNSARVVRGTSTPALLESYEPERLPLINRFNRS
jgi:hypothetical protein